jgi:pimeloyl-ACP methyl ester carboxylesterase
VDQGFVTSPDGTRIAYYVTRERRGRGESGDSSAYAVAREVEDVGAVLEAIGERAFVFGHSAGATLALLAAREYQERVRKLILYEPPLRTAGLRDPSPEGLADRLAAILATGDVEGAMVTFYREGPGHSEAELQRRRGAPLWQTLIPLAPTMPYDVRLPAAADLRVLDLSTFDVPTLLLYGETSEQWLVSCTKLLAPALPNARLEVLAGQGHVAAFTAPEMLANAIDSFLTAP